MKAIKHNNGIVINERYIMSVAAQDADSPTPHITDFTVAVDGLIGNRYGYASMMIQSHDKISTER